MPGMPLRPAAALAAALEDENEVVRRNGALSLARVGAAAGTGGPTRWLRLSPPGLATPATTCAATRVLGLRRLGTPRARGELFAYLESTRWDPSQQRD